MRFSPSELFSTYSIVARDPETGQFGVAVQTHQMCVGSVVQWLLPGVGAVATQAMVNISLGPIGLAMLREGVAAPRVVKALVASDEGAQQRQFAVVDANGQASTFTGENCIPEAGHHAGEGYSVQANMMTNPTVIQAMSQAYENATGPLAQRMVAALRAAQAEDGDIRGMQSAALQIVSGDPTQPDWRSDVDLRVDEHDNPIEELARLVRLSHAHDLDSQGYKLLDDNQREDALAKWAEARAQAPDLEEIAFWQAVTLADNHDDIATAAEILRPVLAGDPRRAQWIDLIRRLGVCDVVEHPERGDALIAKLG